MTGIVHLVIRAVYLWVLNMGVLALFSIGRTISDAPFWWRLVAASISAYAAMYCVSFEEEGRL